MKYFLIRFSTFLLFAVGTLSATSCATILNSEATSITVKTTKPSKIVMGKDTVATENNKAILLVRRSRDPLYISAISDSVAVDSIKIKARNSAAFYGNLYSYGIGFLIDWNKSKRYTYPRHIYLNSDDTLARTYKFDQSPKKGAFYLNFSIPYLNMIELQPVGENTKNGTGFLGLTLGADYYYRDNKFVNVTFGGATSYIIPLPLPIMLSDDEGMYSVFVSASDNYRFKHFSVGYGVSFARNTWNRFEPDELIREPYLPSISKSSNAAGLLLSGYLQAGRKFQIGLVYKPYFIRFKKTDIFDYQHVISLDLIWKSRL